MVKYTGRIDTKIYELESQTCRCKDNRIRIIEYGDKIARVCEVNKNTGHIYRNLCCKINPADNESILGIRKCLIGISGIRSESLGSRSKNF